MTKIFWATMILMAMLLTGCGGEGNSKDIASIKFTKVLIVGIDDEYAPLGFRDEKNQIVGFDVDMAKEVAKRMGVKFEFKSIDWNNKRHELESGDIDLIWNGLDITPKRKEYILFSKPYMDNRQVILVRHGTGDGLRSEGDLAGKVVGTQAGSTSETYIDDNTALKNSLAEFKTYVNYTAGLKALEYGEVDVIIADELLSRYTVSKNYDRFEVVDVTVGPTSEIGIGFRKNDVELRDKVQKAFDDMVKDGTAKKISEQWFNADLIKFKR